MTTGWWRVGAQHRQQVGHHDGTPLLVEFDETLLTQAVERQSDHPDSTFDDSLARGDDLGGLLSDEHRLGDLRRVGEMGDACLDDLDAGHRSPLGQLLGQFLGDAGTIAQRGPPGRARRQGAWWPGDGRPPSDQRLDVFLVVVDGEGRLVTVDDAIDDDRRDLDRVAVGVVKT